MNLLSQRAGSGHVGWRTIKIIATDPPNIRQLPQQHD